MGSRLDSIEIDPVTTEAKAEIGCFSQSITCWPLDECNMRSIEDYITGYADGEGCFTVTFNRPSGYASRMGITSKFLGKSE